MAPLIVPSGSRRSPEYIRWVQGSLNRLLRLNLAVDGIMGSQTRNAIRSFQQQRGLVADGILGPRTEAELAKKTNGAAGTVTTTPMETITAAAARLTGFDKNSARLKDFHAAEIDKVAERIAASWQTGQPIFTVYVKGHASSEGPAQYNIGLGTHRALAVRKALQKALERKQKNLSYKVLVLSQSKGSKEPIDTNKTEEGRSRNRRVEVFLSTKALLPLPKKPPKDDAIRPEQIPWFRPEIPGGTPAPDTEPLCDLTILEAEKKACRDRTLKSIASFGMSLGLPSASAIGFAGSAIGASSLAGLLALAAAAGIAVTYIQVQLATFAYGELQRLKQCMNEAKTKAHCL
jgi:outer membrane protein OmpA-like peptidoglycan-associated protein